MSDEKEIENTIQTYFDSTDDSSAEKVHAAFHPSATITGQPEDVVPTPA